MKVNAEESLAIKVNAEESLAIKVILQALKDVCKNKSKRDVKTAKLFLTSQNDEWEEHRDFISNIAGLSTDWVYNNSVTFMKLPTSIQKERLKAIETEIST